MPRGRPQGFTYLGVLLALSVIGAGLSVAHEVWVTTARRQRFEQLQWVGGQFAQAIGSYYESGSPTARRYPISLEELMSDSRFPFVRRHLRRLYPNPFTGKDDWLLLRAEDGGIRAVCARIDSPADDMVVFGHVPGASPPEAARALRAVRVDCRDRR